VCVIIQQGRAEPHNGNSRLLAKEVINTRNLALVIHVINTRNLALVIHDRANNHYTIHMPVFMHSKYAIHYNRNVWCKAEVINLLKTKIPDLGFNERRDQSMKELRFRFRFRFIDIAHFILREPNFT